MIDPAYHRAPNNSMLNEAKMTSCILPEAVSNPVLSTIEQRSKKTITSVSRKKGERATT